MILYECSECSFGIGGSHPETAEDEYELRQDIESHEEMHRADDEAAGEDASDPITPPESDEQLLQNLAKKGAVILPERAEPLTPADVRAIVREELARSQVLGRFITGATDEGIAELDALPDECLIEATGSYITGDGGFTRCWARPVPSYVIAADRLWQVLVHGDIDYMSSLVPSSRIGLAQVLYVGGDAQ